MEHSSAKYLIDTSVQIKRIMSKKWKEKNLDAIWERCTPVTCYYSLREFRSTVIAALEYLYAVVQDGEGDGNPGDLDAEIRLSDVIMKLTTDAKIRERDRRTKLACAYAAILLEESKSDSKLSTPRRPETIKQFLARIKVEALNLQQIGFFYYKTSRVALLMESLDACNCFLGKEELPFPAGLASYNCRKGTCGCDITAFLESPTTLKVRAAILTGVVKVNDSKLKKGVEQLHSHVSTCAPGRCIGQRLCYPVGDAILVSKACTGSQGLVTADRDQAALANYLSVPVLFYDAAKNEAT